MPNDLFQWEAAGGLVHHCPECFKPLTQKQTKSRCLGEHVEWCQRYHTQLFKKGMSHTCKPCRRSEEEHIERHREIAEKILRLKHLRSEQVEAPTTPLTPKALNAIANSSPLDGRPLDSPKTKKERKAAKKASKVSSLAKVVTMADIEHVARVLHPDETLHEGDNDIDFERRLLEDPEIKDNRYFHKGTSNTRDMRLEIKKDRRSKEGREMSVPVQEIDGLLQLLNVSPLTNASSAEEKSVMTDLRKKIEDDLVQMQREQELLMMRKAGFWRWASAKAYKRLVQNGGIWGQKDQGCKLGDEEDEEIVEEPVRSDSSSSSTDAGTEDSETSAADSGTDITAPSDQDSIASVSEKFETLLSTPKPGSSGSVDADASTPKATSSAAADDGWTTVSKASTTNNKKRAKPVPGNIKLSHNGGIAKLATKTPTPTHQKLFYSNAFYAREDEGDDE